MGLILARGTIGRAKEDAYTVHSGPGIPDWRRLAMQGETKERWMELCEQAAVEQDADKLMKLIQEITRMLDDKDERLKRAQSIGSK